MNGAHSGSSKRNASDQTKKKEARPANGLDVDRSDAEEIQNPAAILASYNGPLQRLADIARYLELSFSHDIAIVEEDYGAEMDRENEIQRLMSVVETLTHAKDERLEALQRQIKDLKASEVDCNKERARFQTIRKDLEEKHAKNEAERDKEFKQKLQKSVRVKSAEIEAGSKDKIQELEKQITSLSATNKKLEQSLSTAEEKLKTKKTRHAIVEKSLMEEIEKLKVELKEVKSELPVEGQSAQY